MIAAGRMYLLNREGRHRTAVAQFNASVKRIYGSDRRLDAHRWAADSLAALGRFGDADRLLAAGYSMCNNATIDPRPIAVLHAARLRIAARMAPFDPGRARRLVWQARHWVLDAPDAAERPDRAELRALAALVDGLLAEGEGRFDAAMAAFEAAAGERVADGQVSGWIRGALDRAVARTDPAEAARRRRAEAALAREPEAAMPRWLMALDRAPGGHRLGHAVLDAWPGAAPAPATADARARARAALARLAADPDTPTRLALWRAELHRRTGDRAAALAALGPAPDAGAPAGDRLIHALVEADLATDPALDGAPSVERSRAAALAAHWDHPEPAAAMVARALLSRTLLAAGDVDGALDAGRAAARRLRAAERSPLRWALPPAWPGRGLALGAYRDAAAARRGEDGPSPRLLRRLDAAAHGERLRSISD